MILCVIAAWLECFPKKPSWCQNGQRESVKHFERSNGLDTALYKNIPLPFSLVTGQIEGKADEALHLTKKRRRKRPKKSKMEDNYPSYLQVRDLYFI